MPVARTSAAAWGIEGKGYVFGGRDAQGELHNDLYIYTPADDRWQAAGETPLRARVSSCACVVGEKVYVGLGFNGKVYTESAYLRDWWEYTPTSNTWRRLSDYPNDHTVGAVAYADGGKIYCVHGFGSSFTAEVACYDIASDTWTIQPRLHYPERASMAGAGGTTQGRHFFGTGYSTKSLNEWFEVDLQGEWTKRRNVPGKREMSVGVGTDQYLYLAGGQHFGGTLTDGVVYDDILRYHPDEDRWTIAGRTDEKAYNRIGFCLEGKAYIGLGEDAEEHILSSLYRIEE